MRGTHNKLGEGDRKVRLGQDSLPNSHFCSGNERKVGTLFYPHPLKDSFLVMRNKVIVAI